MPKQKIIIRLVTTMFIALTLPSFSFAQALQPCRAVAITQARPQQTNNVPPNSENCQQAGEIVTPNANIYKCRGTERPDGEEVANILFLKLANAPLRALPIRDFSINLTHMSVYDVNLGGTPAREHVLALWQAQQNGFGTNFWTVSVFDASWNLLESYDQVEDFGRNHFVQGNGACALAITKFDRETLSPQIDPMFFQAKFVGIVAGSLGPAPGLSPVKRRYTFAFERQRLATFDRQTSIIKQGDLIGWMNAQQ